MKKISHLVPLSQCPSSWLALPNSFVLVSQKKAGQRFLNTLNSWLLSGSFAKSFVCRQGPYALASSQLGQKQAKWLILPQRRTFFKVFHLTPFLISFYWLPVAACIKLRMVTAKLSLYLNSLLQVNIPSSHLRSENKAPDHLRKPLLVQSLCGGMNYQPQPELQHLSQLSKNNSKQSCSAFISLTNNCVFYV